MFLPEAEPYKPLLQAISSLFEAIAEHSMADEERRKLSMAEPQAAEGQRPTQARQTLGRRLGVPEVA